MVKYYFAIYFYPLNRKFVNLTALCGIILYITDVNGGRMTFIIDEKWAGRSVLSFLKAKLKISSSALAALKRDDTGITINGKHITVRHILECGEELYINEKDSFNDVNETIEPFDIPLNIIFENDDIMVIDKPANMPTHPSHNHHSDTVANAIAYIYTQRGEPLVFRPMGRLDKNTSGIVVLAKNAISASFLSYARRSSMINKRYIAILCGRIDVDNSIQVIDTYMKRTSDSVIMRCITDENDETAMRAITHWKLLYTSDTVSVVEAFPKTGRTHQLRVHFAHIGHPILGDDIYGCPSDYIDRHALHAETMWLPLPYSDQHMSFSSNIPQDMQQAFLRLTDEKLDEINTIKQKGIL